MILDKSYLSSLILEKAPQQKFDTYRSKDGIIKMTLKINLRISIILCCLLAPQLLFADDSNKEYSGCGENSNEARLELGRNMSSLIQSEIGQETSVVGSSLFDLFSIDSVWSSFTSKSVTKSEMDLCGVSIVKRNGQQCAIVKHNSLVNCAKNKLDEQLTYRIKNLPDKGTEKRKTAEKWAINIASSDGLYTFVRDQLDQQKLDELKSIENDLKKLLNKQFVLFNIVGEGIKIVVNDSANVRPNQYVSLNVGKHSYRITAPNHCAVEDSFELSAKNRKVIPIDLSSYGYPELTFSSNQSGVRLTVDGKKQRVGSTVTFKKCEGLINYAFNFEGNTEDGKIELKPGIKSEIRETFVSKAEMQRNRTLVKNYEQSNLWQIHYQYISLNRQSQNIDSLYGIKLAKSKLNRAIRTGYELIYAQDDNENYAAEINGKIKLQLLNFGKKNSPLHIGSVVFIPHIGLDVGLGYHRLDKQTNFDNPDSSNWESFYKSYVVARPNIGTDLPINKDISISIEYGRSLFMNEADTFSAGLNIRTNL